MKLILSGLEGPLINELDELWLELTHYININNNCINTKVDTEKQISDTFNNELVLTEQQWKFIPPVYLDAYQEDESKYLLFYRNPIVGLSLAINQGLLLNDYINNWLGSARCLIGFQKLNRQNSLLMDYDAFIANPSALLKSLGKIGIDINLESFLQVSLPENRTTEGHDFFAGSVLLGQHRELQQTLIELQASSIMSKYWAKPSLKQAFFEVEQYQEKVAQFNKQNLIVKELIGRVEQQSNKVLLLESQNNEIQVQITKANKASEQLRIESDQKEQLLLGLKERESENELLLLQLHQVQEELEQTFLDKKALERVTQESQALKEKQSNTLTGMRNEVNELKQTLATTQSKKDEAQSENELLLLQLHQVQEELEQTFLDKKALERVTQESQALKEKQSNTLTGMRNEVNELKQTLATTQSKKDEAQSENELLLLQLHQVQEELEYYYLDNEKYKNTVKRLKIRIVNSASNKEKIKINKNELRVLFNKEWYKKQSGKVFRPLSHYLSKGGKSQFNPHPLFDAKYYIQHNHLENLKENPLIHFLSIGAINGLSPHPLFDIEWYMEMCPDLAESGINPLVHYIKFGGFEERDPSPKFSSKAYIDNYPDVKESAMNPLMHYIVFGQNEDRIIYPSRVK